MGATQAQIQSNLVSLGFNNPSELAAVNEIANGVGITIDNTITEMQNSENNILNIINTQRYGKSGYYTSTALQFQYGYDLSVDSNGNFYYATIDPTAQIIAQAAFEEVVAGNSSQLFIKIATLNPLTNLLQALSPAQLAAFNNYFVNFEIPGVPVTVISANPNIFSFQANATYYATYDLSILITDLQNALLAFRNSFKFNGELFAGDLQDYIKANVPGMRDFYIYNTQIDNMPFPGSQTLSAGYFNYITTIFNNINYIPI